MNNKSVFFFKNKQKFKNMHFASESQNMRNMHNGMKIVSVDIF